MRAVSFVNRVEFDFKGNVAKNAICLGDVDNDKDNELVVGNLQGNLAVFKGEQNQPWFEAHELGMIMVVVVGDILNEDKNSLVCISGEGLCHIYVKNDNNLESEKKNLIPFHFQRLPANTKIALLADVDGDGEVELVLGLTDHVLRTYRWVKIGQNSGSVSGKLVGLHKWEFADQIGSISLNPTEEGGLCVLVAQPGGTYTNFQCPIVDTPEDETEIEDSALLSKLTPKRHPLAVNRMRNPNISSEILGGICGTRDGQKTTSLIAIATLDGTLMLVDGEEILWSLQVDHQLFEITKLDVIGDGEEEVIACAWDGQTYMVNQKRQSVRFQFEEPVCAFTSGEYSVKTGEPVPTLVYATFSDKIFVFYDIRLPSFEIHSLLEEMEQDPEVPALLAQLNIDPNDTEKLRKLYSFCLYGFPAYMKMKEGT